MTAAQAWDLSLVSSELQRAGLSVRGAARLKVVMDRAAAGETRSGDVKHVTGPVYEVRCTSDRREYRLLFAYAREFGLIALGLRFFVKKTQTTPRRHIDVALERWKRWSVEHGEQ